MPRIVVSMNLRSHDGTHGSAREIFGTPDTIGTVVPSASLSRSIVPMKAIFGLVERPPRAFIAAILLCGAAAGCNSGFDAKDSCRQTVACLETIRNASPATDGAIDVCVYMVDAAYDNASSAAQEQFDRNYESCEGETSCGFFACFCDEADSLTSECDDARASL
jgi:hypothetical protein